MARKLVARFDWAREMVAAADRIQENAGLPTISETVFADVLRIASICSRSMQFAEHWLAQRSPKLRS
jgi:hypothetical protein